MHKVTSYKLFDGSVYTYGGGDEIQEGGTAEILNQHASYPVAERTFGEPTLLSGELHGFSPWGMQMSMAWGQRIRITYETGDYETFRIDDLTLSESGGTHRYRAIPIWADLDGSIFQYRLNDDGELWDVQPFRGRTVDEVLTEVFNTDNGINGYFKKGNIDASFTSVAVSLEADGSSHLELIQNVLDQLDGAVAQWREDATSCYLDIVPVPSGAATDGPITGVSGNSSNQPNALNLTVRRRPDDWITRIHPLGTDPGYTLDKAIFIVTNVVDVLGDKTITLSTDDKLLVWEDDSWINYKVEFWDDVANEFNYGTITTTNATSGTLLVTPQIGSNWTNTTGWLRILDPNIGAGEGTRVPYVIARTLENSGPRVERKIEFDVSPYRDLFALAGGSSNMSSGTTDGGGNYIPDGLNLHGTDIQFYIKTLTQATTEVPPDPPAATATLELYGGDLTADFPAATAFDIINVGDGNNGSFVTIGAATYNAGPDTTTITFAPTGYGDFSFAEGIAWITATVLPVTEEITDGEYIRYGSKAVKITCNYVGQGFVSDTITRVNWNHEQFPNQSVWMAGRVTSGRMRLQFNTYVWPPLVVGGPFPQRYPTRPQDNQLAADEILATGISWEVPSTYNGEIYIEAMEDGTVFYLDALTCTQSDTPQELLNGMGPAALVDAAGRYFKEIIQNSGPTINARIFDLEEMGVGSHVRPDPGDMIEVRGFWSETDSQYKLDDTYRIHKVYDTILADGSNRVAEVERRLQLRDTAEDLRFSFIRLPGTPGNSDIPPLQFRGARTRPVRAQNDIISQQVTYEAQNSTPAVTPPAGHYKTYPKADGNFYILDAQGNEYPIGGASNTPIYDSMVELSNTMTFDGTTDQTTQMRTLFSNMMTNQRPLVVGATNNDSSLEVRITDTIEVYTSTQMPFTTAPVHYIGNQSSGRWDYLPAAQTTIALDVGDGDAQHYDDLYIANFNGGAEGAYGWGMVLGKLGKNHEGTPGDSNTWASVSRSTLWRPQFLSMDRGFGYQRGWITDIYSIKANWNADYGIWSLDDGVNDGTGEINAINFWGGMAETNRIGIYYNHTGSAANIAHWGFTVEGSTDKEIEIQGTGTLYGFHQLYLESSNGTITHFMDVGSDPGSSIAGVSINDMTVAGTEPVMFDNVFRLKVDHYGKHQAFSRLYVGPGVRQSWITKPTETGTASRVYIRSVFVDNPRNHGPDPIWSTDFGDLDSSHFPLDGGTIGVTNYPLDKSGMYKLYIGTAYHVALEDVDTDLNDSGRALTMTGSNQGTDSLFRFRIGHEATDWEYTEHPYETYVEDNRNIVEQKIGRKAHVRVLLMWGANATEKPSTPSAGASYRWLDAVDVSTSPSIQSISNFASADADWIDWAPGKPVWVGLDVDMSAGIDDVAFDAIEWLEYWFQPTASGSWGANEKLYVYKIEVYPTEQGPWELSGYRNPVTRDQAYIWQANVGRLDLNEVRQKADRPDSLSNAQYQVYPRKWLDWTIGSLPTGATASNNFGYRHYTTTGNNTIEEKVLPGGEQVGPVWVGTSSVADGNNMGFFMPKVYVNPNKTYTISCWYRAENALTDGTVYFGIRSDDFDMVDHGDATTTYANPYNWSGDLPALNTWYEIRAKVHAAGTTGGNSLAYADDHVDDSGIYDETGVKVADIHRDLQFPTGHGDSVQVYLTCFAIAGASGTVRWFAWPRMVEDNAFTPRPWHSASQAAWNAIPRDGSAFTIGLDGSLNTINGRTLFDNGTNDTAIIEIAAPVDTPSIPLIAFRNAYDANDWIGFRSLSVGNNDMDFAISKKFSFESIVDFMKFFGTSGASGSSDWIEVYREMVLTSTLATQSTDATISSGSITPTSSFVRVETETTIAADDLDTIASPVDGQFLILKWNDDNSSFAVTVKHGTGNVFMTSGADFVLNSINQVLLLFYDFANTRWVGIDPTGEVNTVSDTGGGLSLHGAKVGADIPFYTLNSTYFAQAGGLISIAAGGVNNSRMANMNAWTFKGNITASAATPTDWKIGDLVEDVGPGSGDWVIIETGGALRKVDWDNLPGAAGGEANTYSDLTSGVSLRGTKTGSDLPFKVLSSQFTDVSDVLSIQGAAYSIFLRNAATTGNLAATKIGSLTSTTDATLLLMAEDSSGDLKYVTAETLRSRQQDNIFDCTLSSATQNTNAATTYTWDSSGGSIDTSEATHTTATSKVTIDNAREIRIYCVIEVDDASIGRSIFGVQVKHYNSSDVLQDTYWLSTSVYIRTSVSTYDSGLAAGHMDMVVAAGDKIEIASVVLDQETTGNNYADQTGSRLKIDIVY